jgi:FkbM family methyltransferase
MTKPGPSPRRLAFKRAVQHAVHTVGLHVGRFPPVDSLAYHLREVLRELRIDCVLDVGAHDGEFAGFLRELGYQGQIVSFEPARESFTTLSRARAGDAAWRGENLALGAEDGELDLNIYRGSVFNSFLKPGDDRPELFRADTELVRVDKVPVRRLEAILDGILAARPAARIFLKMDTQGYDLQVVRGAGARLDSILGLQTELAVRATYAGMPTWTEALTELGGRGFHLSGLFPVARDSDQLRLIELDCVMVRAPAA